MCAAAALDATAAAAESPSAAPQPAKRWSSHTCRVDGCGAVLRAEKPFYRRSRCCKTHATAAEVYLDGEARRFCQQCCCFHPVAAFDGSRRSCRERLAAHASRQRHNWLARQGQRGSEGAASSGSDDQGGARAQGAGGAAPTRAGHRSPRPGPLPAPAGTPGSDAAASLERQPAPLASRFQQQEPSVIAATAAGGRSCQSAWAFPAASGTDTGLRSSFAASHADVPSTRPRPQQTQRQRPPVTPFEKALAKSMRSSSDVIRKSPQHRLQSRRSTSLGQMQIGELLPASFWSETGRPSAHPELPVGSTAPDGVLQFQVSWSPALQARERAPSSCDIRVHDEEPDTEAAPTAALAPPQQAAPSAAPAPQQQAAPRPQPPAGLRSMPVADAHLAGAQPAEGGLAPAAAGAGCWPMQHRELGPASILSVPEAAALHSWTGSLQLDDQQPQPQMGMQTVYNTATLQQPQQQQLPAPVLRFEKMRQPPPATGKATEQHRLGMASSSDVGPADSHARAAAALDFGWETSLADMDVDAQQGVDATTAMETRVGPPAELQHDQQAAAAAEALHHRRANTAAGNLGFSNEAEACAFANQASEPLWLAQQLIGATLKTEDQPLYSYGLADVLPPMSSSHDWGRSPPPQQHPQQRHSGSCSRPPLQHNTGRSAARLAREASGVGSTDNVALESAQAAQVLHRQEPAADCLQQSRQAAFRAQRRTLGCRRGHRREQVGAALRQLHAEHGELQRLLCRPADDVWARRRALALSNERFCALPGA